MKESIKHIIETTSGTSLFMLILAIFVYLGNDNRATSYFIQTAITPLFVIFIISILILLLLNTNIIKKIFEWLEK